MNNIILIILGALCCGSISFTISVTAIFKPVREYISSKHKKLEDLIHCPWCLGHWITIIYLLISVNVNYLFISNFVFINFCITLFMMMSIEGLLHYVLLRAYEPVQKVLAQRKIDKLKNKNI